jgi:phosphoglucosamine mutase
MERMFGTDGVRGVANVHPMTAEMALAIGRATAYICKKRSNTRPVIVIGKDTRLSCDMLEAALAAGICSMGGNALLAGVLPTPGIAYITRSLWADAGMVVSASHNPFEDNGIKIFSRDGFKLPDAEENEIENLIAPGKIGEALPTAAEIGRMRRLSDAPTRYIEFCKNTFHENLDLEGINIVLDCANGATYKTAPAVFRGLGANVECIHCSPDGTNINENCGSQHTEALVARVLETRATLGLAFDGDGDRLIAVDEKGNHITGDHIMAICARLYKDLGLLGNNLVIATVMSNFGFFTAMRNLGVETEISAVGDRYVLEMMQGKNAVLGGEQSGHVLFLNHHTSGDGIITAVQLLWAMRHYGQPLSELAKVMSLSPQRLINITVSRKPPLEEIAALRDAIRAAEAELGDSGRVLVRYSGTQSMCRVMVEGPTKEITDRLAGVLAEAVRINIG